MVVKILHLLVTFVTGEVQIYLRNQLLFLKISVMNDYNGYLFYPSGHIDWSKIEYYLLK